MDNLEKRVEDLEKRVGNLESEMKTVPHLQNVDELAEGLISSVLQNAYEPRKETGM